MYLSISRPRHRIFLPPRLQGALGQTATDLPSTIETLATDASAMIQATTNPNSAPYVGNLTNPLPGYTAQPSAIAAAGVGTLALFAVGAFLLFRAMKK